MENLELEYIKPDLTLKYFLFNGDIAAISNANTDDGKIPTDNVSVAPDESDPWWGGNTGFGDGNGF